MKYHHTNSSNHALNHDHEQNRALSQSGDEEGFSLKYPCLHVADDDDVNVYGPRSSPPIQEIPNEDSPNYEELPATDDPDEKDDVCK